MPPGTGAVFPSIVEMEKLRPGTALAQRPRSRARHLGGQGAGLAVAAQGWAPSRRSPSP